MDSAPDFPSNHVVPVWFNVVPTMPKRWHMLVSRRPNDEKQCGSHVVPRGSNNDDMAQIPFKACGSCVVQRSSNKCRRKRIVATKQNVPGWLWTAAGCEQRANKRRTSNGSPSPITSAAVHGGAARGGFGRTAGL